MTLVPKNRIPKVYPVCPSCGGGTKTMFGTPHATGYFRRHLCQICGTGFYSLAPFVGEPGEPEYSTSPFHDRALTELEQVKRKLWWDEADNGEVTLNGYPLDIPGRMASALRKKQEDRNEIDKLLVATHDRLLTHFKSMAMEP